jgi:hypothetical protein
LRAIPDKANRFLPEEIQELGDGFRGVYTN